MKVRVGINLEYINPEYSGGITSYAMGLAKAFAKCENDKIKYIFYINSENEKLFSELISKSNYKNTIVIKKIQKSKNKRRYSFFKKNYPTLFLMGLFMSFLNINQRRKLNKSVDILYTPHNPGIGFPYIKRKLVFSLHDLQHEHFPSFFSQEELIYRKYTYNKAAKKSQILQASSLQMKNDFQKIFGDKVHGKVHIIKEGVDLEFFQSASNLNSFEKSTIEKYSEFFYMPAQLWPHKNHETVLRAFAMLNLKYPTIKLVLTGAPYSAHNSIFALIRDLNLINNVDYLGVVSREMVKSLYQNCLGVISAALYESNSLPILEAAACGKAIIAGDTPPNIEISKELELNLFKTTDHENLADVIEKLMTSKSSASEITNLKNIKNFEWQAIAEAYNKLFIFIHNHK
jgi:glycosyltransferase involved in cell wall biosynthesis